MSDQPRAEPCYENPVYSHAFPDPFVLKFRGEYWAYCTGVWHDGRCFGVLHSRDLIHWDERPGAMAMPHEDWTEYWAPEVSYWDGTFYLYYSAGNEEWMQLRVATSRHPGGPFVDSGRRLTSQQFAIDAHVFTDHDGTRSMFYATDFLDGDRVGTGTVYDRMIDPYTLAGAPRPVTRARYDWQIYDPQREEKGGVCWHTVEGPFVLSHKDRYYQMFSGGNWKNTSYGVGYATAESLDEPGEWEQTIDGEQVLPILRTVPEEIIGPGHNSVVRGPDNLQLFCVYHRWVDGHRTMAIDRLDWVGERLVVLGPTNSPQPAPTPATLSGIGREPASDALGLGWHGAAGRWRVGEGAAVQEDTALPAEARHAVDATALVCEVSLRQVARTDPAGRYGVGLDGGGRPLLRFWLEPGRHAAAVYVPGGPAEEEMQLDLPAQFEPEASYTVRLVVDGRRVSVALEGTAVRWQGRLAGGAGELTLQTEGAAAAFEGFALTYGWEDLFQGPERSVADLGWQGAGTWLLEDGVLRHIGPAEEADVSKGPPLENYELVINARLVGPEADGCYGFYPARLPDGDGPLLTVRRQSGWALVAQWQGVEQAFPLPAEFEAGIPQQFRCRKEHGRLTVQWEGQQLGALEVFPGPTSVGLYARKAGAAFDLVRMTALPPPA